MRYESSVVVPSKVAAGVSYTVAKMSFGRRTELMRQVRELSARMEFLEASPALQDKMDAALLKAEIDRVFLNWGLLSIAGLELDGEAATPQGLAERGPEELFGEALHAVKSQTGLNEAERENSESHSSFSSPTRPDGSATLAGVPAWNGAEGAAG